MKNHRTHLALVETRLRSLRPLLSSIPGSKNYSDLFDEFLVEAEFGLALETLCDCLLEPLAPPVGELDLQEIEGLHVLMEVADSCVAKLRDKCSTESK